MRLDARFHGTIVRNKDGREVPEDEWVAFLVTDDGIVAMLLDYGVQLEKDGAAVDQRSAVEELRRRVRAVREGRDATVGVRLDLKVHGTLICEEHGREVPPTAYVIFRPHDNSFLPVLRNYRKDLERTEASAERQSEVDELVALVVAWRAAHPERCKVADVQEGELC